MKGALSAVDIANGPADWCKQLIVIVVTLQNRSECENNYSLFHS